VLERVKRHGLIPTALAVGSATFLSDVPEFWPLGQEIGIAVMGLGYSYIAAHIFNWLVVERPRAEEYRAHYRASVLSLHRLATVPPIMIYAVFAESGMAQNKWEADSPEEIADALKRIDWGYFDVHSHDLFASMRRAIEQHREAYKAVIPFLSKFEPRVSAAIARLDSAGIHEYLRDVEAAPRFMTDAGNQIFLARKLFEYQHLGDELRNALGDSRFMPGRQQSPK
jgi:hypothetical protein